MILPEDRPDSPSKLPQPAEPLPQDAAPPAYPGHEAGSSRIAAGPPPHNETQPLNMQPQPIYIPVYIKPPDAGPERRARKRFFRAFLIAIFLYIVVGALLRSVFEIAVWRGGGRHFEREDESSAQPRPSDGKVLSCIKGADHWTDHNGHLMTTFRLDRLSDVLYLFARGQQLTGNVMITQDESLHYPGVVLVDITAQNHTSDWLRAVQVCSLERQPGQQGVGIFSPMRWRSRTQMLPELEFDVTIRLPKVDMDEPLQIARLETNMPSFTQHVGDLKDKVIFRHLSLKSSNANILSQSLKAYNAEVITSNSRVVGNYEVSESLRLITSHGVINVTTTLIHRNPKTPGPILRMQSSSSQIVASVNLVSELPPVAYRQGGSYSVTANTSNARLALDFPSAPLDSVLKVAGSTTNAKARVQLHPTWEGRFDVRTSGYVVSVDDRHVEDPSGKGRTRDFQWFGKWEHMQGLATWDGQYIGTVDLRTSNAPVELSL